MNDHLAGSTVALELLEHMQATLRGTELERFFADLHADITSDRRELEALMERLDIAQSPMRKAGAWLSEKMAQVKLRVDDPSGSAFYLLEGLDGLTVGIEGKLALWQALEAATAVVPSLQGVDYARLKERASEQRQRVEQKRLEAAVQAFRDVARD